MADAEDDVYEPVAYTLAAVLGVVIIVIIILMMIAYNRLYRPYVLEPPPVEPDKPPDESLGYPYPGYKVPEREPEVILIPPVIAPLPPADYVIDAGDDDGPLPPPDTFVLPAGPMPPPPPKQPDLRIIKMKRRKKKRRDSSSSSSESDSSCDGCHGGCHGDCHGGCHPVSPSMMMLVKPQPVGMTVFTSAPQLTEVRAVEHQTRLAEVGPVQKPCAGTPCF